MNTKEEIFKKTTKYITSHPGIIRDVAALKALVEDDGVTDELLKEALAQVYGIVAILVWMLEDE